MERTEQDAGALPLSKLAYNGLSLLRELEYRPMQDPESLETLYRFRYNCYAKKGLIEENASKLSYDSMDEVPGVMRFGVYRDGTLLSSIRIHYANPENPVTPSRLVYPEIVGDMLDNKGYSTIDSSRFTVDPEASREFPMITYLTIRLAALAAVHFEADYCFSTVRRTHVAFYRRVIGATVIDESKYYEGLNFPVSLCTSKCSTDGRKALQRYPFFHSLPHERRMLFEGHYRNEAAPLTVLPTASQAFAA